MYIGPCILRSPVRPEKYGLKLKVFLKWSDIYMKNIRAVSLIMLMASFKVRDPDLIERS